MKPETNRPQESGPSRNGPTIPIVGIGASAGGIGALETLVPLFERGAGLAYVVVQHLDPERKSGLTGLLGRTAKIPVTEIADQVTIEADHVYVIPPNAALAISDKRLKISPPVEQRFQRTPIDGFFISLAEANGECSAGVILSGTGSDGTIGLRAIKEHGGLTMAQDDAEYDGMMRSAVRSGMVDFVLPLEKIPARLNDYFRHLTNVEARKGPDGVRPEAADHLAQIAALLRTRTGHDFSGYKDKTVARRVQRRMQVLQIDEVPDFIERLRKEPLELDALLQDLLIGVTNFFRDPPAFEALEREVIPQLFAGKGPDDTVRVWVPGCSTGEEAYSIAILLREHMPRLARAQAADLRQRHRRALAADRPDRPLPLDHRQGHPAGPAGAPFRARGRHLSHRQRPARDLPVLLAQPAARRAVLQARPDHLPQPPDLPHAGAAEPVDPAVPLCAERRRLPVPRHLGERDAPSAPVQHASTSSIASSSASRCSSAGCRNSR